MIQAQDLIKRYGAFEAVRGVSFEVGPGQVTGLLGPNGAGKTTVMKMLTGFHYPSSGTAVVAGHDVLRDPVAAKRATGYLSESAPLYPELTVRDYLDFIARSRRLPKPLEAIERVVHTAALESVLPRPIEQLSKGFRQRVALAQAIIHDPEVLILDEPTSGLDPNQIVEIRRIIAELGRRKTVILSTHILQEVDSVCDRLLIMHQGMIVAEGTTAEIARRMRGHAVYRLRLNRAVEPDRFIAELDGCIAAEAVVRDGDPHWYHLSIAEDDGAMVAERIFDWVVTNNLKLLGLESDRTTLEQVFQQLTIGGAQ